MMWACFWLNNTECACHGSNIGVGYWIFSMSFTGSLLISCWLKSYFHKCWNNYLGAHWSLQNQGMVTSTRYLPSYTNIQRQSILHMLCAVLVLCASRKSASNFFIATIGDMPIKIAWYYVGDNICQMMGKTNEVLWGLTRHSLWKL